MLAYNEANRKVAILCNHQRTVTKAMENTLENLAEKVRHPSTCPLSHLLHKSPEKKMQLLPLAMPHLVCLLCPL